METIFNPYFWFLVLKEQKKTEDTKYQKMLEVNVLSSTKDRS